VTRGVNGESGGGKAAREAPGQEKRDSLGKRRPGNDGLLVAGQEEKRLQAAALHKR